jgi:hypothetical protein
MFSRVHKVQQATEGPDIALTTVNGVTSCLGSTPLLEASVATDGRRFVQIYRHVKVNDCQSGFSILISDYYVIRLEVTVTNVGLVNAINCFN